jgi:hypothetical protein
MYYKYICRDHLLKIALQIFEIQLQITVRLVLVVRTVRHLLRNCTKITQFLRKIVKNMGHKKFKKATWLNLQFSVNKYYQ